MLKGGLTQGIFLSSVAKELLHERRSWYFTTDTTSMYVASDDTIFFMLLYEYVVFSFQGSSLLVSLKVIYKTPWEKITKVCLNKM